MTDQTVQQGGHLFLSEESHQAIGDDHGRAIRGNLLQPCRMFDFLNHIRLLRLNREGLTSSTTSGFLRLNREGLTSSTTSGFLRLNREGWNVFAGIRAAMFRRDFDLTDHCRRQALFIDELLKL